LAPDTDDERNATEIVGERRAAAIRVIVFYRPTPL
jgi:hypothetical protein